VGVCRGSMTPECVQLLQRRQCGASLPRTSRGMPGGGLLRCVPVARAGRPLLPPRRDGCCRAARWLAISVLRCVLWLWKLPGGRALA
jgi:hypothetical protein